MHQPGNTRHAARHLWQTRSNHWDSDGRKPGSPPKLKFPGAGSIWKQSIVKTVMCLEIILCIFVFGQLSLFLFLSRHSNFACLNMNQVLFGIVTLRSRCTNCILYSLHHFALETWSRWFVHISGRELKFIDYDLSFLSSIWWDDFGTPGSNSWLPCSQIFPVKI